jgi:hypothetical protein
MVAVTSYTLPAPEQVTIDDELWAKAEHEGRVSIGPEGRRKVVEELKAFARRAREKRKLPAGAISFPLERLQNAAEEMQAALAAMDVPDAKHLAKVKYRTKREAAIVAADAVRLAKSDLFLRHYQVIWNRKPDTDDGYTTEEFQFRFEKFFAWWATLAKDIAQIKDAAALSKDLVKLVVPRGKTNYPLLGCINGLSAIYVSAGGTAAAKQARPPKFHAALLGLPDPLSRPLADQFSLQLGDTCENRQHELGVLVARVELRLVDKADPHAPLGSAMQGR